MKEIFRRGAVSFAISSMAGLIVNLLIDIIVNSTGGTGFLSIAPAFLALFPTPVAAAYVNILLYGVIGASFSMMTFIFECSRIGYLIQGLIYFTVTALVCMGITILLWQLHRYPAAFISTLAGYGVTYLIMGMVRFRQLKADIR
ncbi:MAG: DUF3021 family protein, partial [Parasporobacterium sp.]|nr:DUF3021 family protein [Parasporobacterium sp.]